MRPVIWAILAILVVLAIVFVVVARKGAGTPKVNPMTAADFTTFADHMDNYAQNYLDRAAKLTAAGKNIDQITAKINELKTAVADLRSSPSEDKVSKIRALYKEVKKAYRDAGGAGAAPSGDTTGSP